MADEKLENGIKRLTAGDGRAFDYVYARTNRAVYFSVLYIVRNRADAEDLLQETYVRALRRLDGYEAGTNFTAWLCTIGKNLAYNFVKKRKRETVTDFSADEKSGGTYEMETPYIFSLAAEVLTEEEYEVLMLCQVAGYRRWEVSQMLSMPVGTVTWKNGEALKKLKAALEKGERQ